MLAIAKLAAVAATLPFALFSPRFARKQVYRAARQAGLVYAALGGQSVCLLDIGSAGGIEPRWKQISNRVRYTGLEPDARSNGVDGCDFVKLDIQGGELAALRGGERLLSRVFGLEVEVEFIPVYRGKPLFGHVTEFLAAKGLEFIDFTSMHRWSRNSRGDVGQCVFADALFLQSPECVWQEFGAGGLSAGDIRRYLAILALYRRVDLMIAFQALFSDLLSQETDLARDLSSAVRNLSRELRWLRGVLWLVQSLLKSVGNDMRLRCTY